MVLNQGLCQVSEDHLVSLDLLRYQFWHEKDTFYILKCSQIDNNILHYRASLRLDPAVCKVHQNASYTLFIFIQIQIQKKIYIIFP